MGKAKKNKKFRKSNLGWVRDKEGNYEYLDKKDIRLAKMMKKINEK